MYFLVIHLFHSCCNWPAPTHSSGSSIFVLVCCFNLTKLCTCFRYSHLLPDDEEAFDSYNTFSARRLDEVVFQYDVWESFFLFEWVISSRYCGLYTVLMKIKFGKYHDILFICFHRSLVIYLFGINSIRIVVDFLFLFWCFAVPYLHPLVFSSWVFVDAMPNCVIVYEMDFFLGKG